MKIPKLIDYKIKGEEYKLDDIGHSESKVLIFKEKVLKIQENNHEAINEVNVLKNLDNILNIPKVIDHVMENNTSYLLMSKIEGNMLCSDIYLSNLDILINIIKRALKLLWRVDIKKINYPLTLDKKLELAKFNVENNLVDIEDSQEETYGEGGFKNPLELLQWLIDNKPEEELVFSHGDFTLPNILVNSKVDKQLEIGFIDLGRAGVSDKWQDLALLYRCVSRNLEGKYGNKKYEPVDKFKFFEKLGIDIDEKKLKYYILLDELF